MLLLIITSLLLVIPNTILDLSELDPSHNGAVGIQSNTPEWYNSTVRFTDVEGHNELLVFHYLPDVSAAWIEPKKTFSHPTECSITFYCLGLNLSLGPYTFFSDTETTFYYDYESQSWISWAIRNEG